MDEILYKILASKIFQKRHHCATTSSRVEPIASHVVPRQYVRLKKYRSETRPRYFHGGSSLLGWPGAERFEDLGLFGTRELEVASWSGGVFGTWDFYGIMFAVLEALLLCTLYRGYFFFLFTILFPIARLQRKMMEGLRSINGIIAEISFLNFFWKKFFLVVFMTVRDE